MVFWVMTSSVLAGYQCFAGEYCLRHQVLLRLEAVYSDMLVPTYQTTRYRNRESII
jgi:hypothetical protein